MVQITKLKGLKTELINVLRWEDDGGKIMEVNDSWPDQQFMQSALRRGGVYDASLKWNEQFVIEPFRASTRIDLIKRKVPNKVSLEAVTRLRKHN